MGHHLKQYPIVGKGQRIVIKDQQAIVKSQLGKGKGRMASGEEDGMPPTIRDRMEVDNLHHNCSTIMANIDISFAFFDFVIGGLFIQKALILRLDHRCTFRILHS
jgi:hypothetical protein